MPTYTITDTITGETYKVDGTWDLYPTTRALFGSDDAEILHAIEQLCEAVTRDDATIADEYMAYLGVRVSRDS